MKSTLALGITALIVAAGAYFFVFSDGDNSSSSSNSTNTTTSTPASTSTPAVSVTPEETPEASPTEAVEALTEGTVAEHSDPGDCWTIINDKVYDITSYIASGNHPGGEAINDACGTDGTAFFEGATAASNGRSNNHSGNAASILEGFLLGDLVAL